jgi:TonB family protein
MFRLSVLSAFCATLVGCASTGTPAAAVTEGTAPHTCSGTPIDSTLVAQAVVVSDLNEIHPELNSGNGRGPTYPPELRDSHVQGLVRASFTIEPDGSISLPSVVIESATHPAFARSVCDALTIRMRFTALVRGGQRVPSRVRSMPFQFELPYRPPGRRPNESETDNDL